MSESQSCSDVLMIRPTAFAANLQTASTNHFQRPDCDADHVQAVALAEFEGLATVLRAAGVRVHVFDDTAEPHTPDSIFPNNWVSFHGDGSVVLYPMLAPNRRLERRQDILESLSGAGGFRIQRVFDLSHREADATFLEGTGSLVLDRVNRIAYACLSPRTHLDVLGEFSQQLDYEVVAFEGNDGRGQAIYHTNVMLTVGSRLAVICAEAIRPDQRESVLGTLRSTGHELIELSFGQMDEFAGNMLELSTAKNRTVIALSARAEHALTDRQKRRLEEKVGPLISAAIPTIEALGGGSVRCMLAEIHLPRR